MAEAKFFVASFGDRRRQEGEIPAKLEKGENLRSIEVTTEGESPGRHGKGLSRKRNPEGVHVSWGSR